jgi:HSP20 family molecular chaperone IbpA
MKKIIGITILILSLNLFAQTKEEREMQRQFEEIMKARAEMIKSLFDDSDTDFGGLDRKFEDLIKNFDRGSFPTIANQEAGEVIGEYDWRETPTHQVFALKVKQIKDKPLDIKIEKGQIKLKGDVESVDVKNPKSKRITKVHFERTFSIPDGVDQGNPEFENKAGELLIKFKKIQNKMPSKVKKMDPNQQLPIGKDAGDVSI